MKVPDPNKLNLYDVLQVTQQATPDEIQSAFRRLVKKYHPDRNNSPDASRRFQQIRDAYACLGNPVSRSDYDRLVHSRRREHEEQAARKRAAQAQQEQERQREAEWQAEAARAAGVDDAGMGGYDYDPWQTYRPDRVVQDAPEEYPFRSIWPEEDDTNVTANNQGDVVEYSPDEKLLRMAKGSFGVAVGCSIVLTIVQSVAIAIWCVCSGQILLAVLCMTVGLVFFAVGWLAITYLIAAFIVGLQVMSAGIQSK